MASIGGLSTTTSSSLGTLRGYGGLSSGLDRDSLIESMTAATRSKIEAQQAKKTKIQWKQTAVQSISSKMIAFAEKYVSSMSSASNLYSSVFWGQSNVSVMGANSKYVTASGSSSTADSFTVAGVKQLAQKASLTSGAASDKTLQTGEIDLDALQTVGNLQGKTLTISFDGKSPYTVVLPTGQKADGTEYDYTTAEGVAEAINAALQKKELSENNRYDGISNLGDVLKVEAGADGSLTFKNVEERGSHSIEIQGGTALEYLGVEKNSEDAYDAIEISQSGDSHTFAKDDIDLTTERTFAERIAGQTLDFTYNGKTQTIKMPGAEELEGKTAAEMKETIQKSLQSQLDSAFGTGRIQASWDNDAGATGKLQFTTTKPDGSKDDSSVLTVSSGSSELLGKGGALNMEYGESNRVNLRAKLNTSGLAANISFDANGEATIKINDKDVVIKETDTVIDLISRINEQTDVDVTYQASSDTFTFTSKQDGASGKVELDANAQALFKGAAADGAKGKDGQDAIISIRYTNTDEVVDLTRGTNTFEMEGLTITVKNKFGDYGADGNGPLNVNYDDEVIFNAEVDADKITSTVKQMVEDINEIISMVNKEVSTKPDKDYSPLTESQKKDMSEDEIKAWEEKAKQGILFNDNDIKFLSWDLSSLLSSSDLQALKEIGISTSDSYADNGKLVFDETKFRAALAADPQKVEELFTKKAGTDASGNTISNGIAANLEKVMDKYVKTLGTTKGILLEKAGNSKSPLSVTNNEYYKQMKEIEELIESLNTRLKNEQDRYISQFTTLETLISQMNSQSSMLGSLSGGY